jgi:hypothetical protein
VGSVSPNLKEHDETNLGVTFKDGFSNEVSEVERVADVGAPTEEVGEAQNAQRAGHVDDGQQVLLQGGAALFCRDAYSILRHTTYHTYLYSEVHSSNPDQGIGYCDIAIFSNIFPTILNTKV